MSVYNATWKYHIRAFECHCFSVLVTTDTRLQTACKQSICKAAHFQGTTANTYSDSRVEHAGQHDLFVRVDLRSTEAQLQRIVALGLNDVQHVGTVVKLRSAHVFAVHTQQDVSNCKQNGNQMQLNQYNKQFYQKFKLETSTFNAISLSKRNGDFVVENF